jgi:hypothetical protein
VLRDQLGDAQPAVPVAEQYQWSHGGHEDDKQERGREAAVAGKAALNMGYELLFRKFSETPAALND